MEDRYDFSKFSDSDDDDDDAGLKNTIAAIRKLDSHKLVLPAERSEPSLQVDEFHLIKEGDGGSAVKLSELTRTLNKKFKDSTLLNELKVAHRQTKTLPKPLEKPEADKVQRTVGFEKVKTQLTNWEPLVQQNRVAEHQVFPLPKPGELNSTKEEFVASIKPETDLEKRMAEILKKENPNLEQEEGETPLFRFSLEEMMERRKDAARLRAQQSYIVAKARRQNKIKSKTYHRIARRERIRNQMKEFEALQKTNPEEALKRIEEIEKERVLERVTLRHRNTGKWAKNQAVRAKYNKESREVLSEQLKLSRDLTKKVAIESESSEEEGEGEDGANNIVSDNPWVNGTKTEAQVDAFVKGFRQFWDGKGQPEENESQEVKPVAEEEPEVLDARAKRLLNSAVVAASAAVLAQEDTSLENNCLSTSKKPKVNGRLKESVNVNKSIKETVATLNGLESKNNKKKNVKTDENYLESKNKKKNVKTDEDQGPSSTGDRKSGDISRKKLNRPTVVAKKTGLKVTEAKSVRTSFVVSKSGKWKVSVKEEPSKSPTVEKKKEAKQTKEKPNKLSSVDKKVNTKQGKVKPNESPSAEKKNKTKEKLKKPSSVDKVKTKQIEKPNELSVSKKENPKRATGIAAMFDKMDSKLKEKAEEKVKKLKRALRDEPKTKKEKRRKTDKAEAPVSSGLRPTRIRIDDDQPLDEGPRVESESVPVRVDVSSVGDDLVETAEKSAALPEIDPNNFIKTVRTNLQTAIPDLIANGDEAMDDDEGMGAVANQQLTISEAFADDDVVAEFEQEKMDEIDKNKPKDIDLSLPGWGSWGGHNIKTNQRKKKRFIIKAPKPGKRRDENKGNIFVNEKEENKLKPQQVSEIPFPFTSVKDFEASVGAPISNTFIPETAHRKLILPRVLTKSGAVIKPLTKDDLGKPKQEKVTRFKGRKTDRAGKQVRNSGPRKAKKLTK